MTVVTPAIPQEIISLEDSEEIANDESNKVDEIERLIAERDDDSVSPNASTTRPSISETMECQIYEEVEVVLETRLFSTDQDKHEEDEDQSGGENIPTIVDANESCQGDTNASTKKRKARAKSKVSETSSSASAPASAPKKPRTKKAKSPDVEIIEDLSTPSDEAHVDLTSSPDKQDDGNACPTSDGTIPKPKPKPTRRSKAKAPTQQSPPVEANNDTSSEMQVGGDGQGQGALTGEGCGAIDGEVNASSITASSKPNTRKRSNPKVSSQSSVPDPINLTEGEGEGEAEAEYKAKGKGKSKGKITGDAGVTTSSSGADVGEEALMSPEATFKVNNCKSRMQALTAELETLEL